MVPPPEATVGLPKFCVMVKPAGADKAESVSVAVPLLVTVKVFVTGVPAGVVPKLIEPSSGTSPTPVSVTEISGAPTMYIP